MATASTAQTPVKPTIDMFAKLGTSRGQKVKQRLTPEETSKIALKKKRDNLKGILDEEWNGNRNEKGQTCKDMLEERVQLHSEDPKKNPLGCMFTTF